MGTMKTGLQVGIASLLLVASVTANAALVGVQFTAGYYVPDTSSLYGGASFTPSTFIVGTGTETTGVVEGVTTIPIDFDSSTLDLTLNTTISPPAVPKWFPAGFNGIIFTSSTPHGITSATVDSSTTMPGFDNSRVTFDGDQIFINWQDLTYSSGDTVRVNFAFAPVPLPAAAWLLISGLAALGVLARRRVAG